MNDPEFIALYGSLRRGQAPHMDLGLDRMLRYAGPCRLEGRLYDFGDWPGLMAGPGTVAAELYEIVAEDALAHLDSYEDCDMANPATSLFVRETVDLVEPAGARAHVYIYNREPGAAPLVAGGDWVAYLRERG